MVWPDELRGIITRILLRWIFPEDASCHASKHLCRLPSVTIMCKSVITAYIIRVNVRTFAIRMLPIIRVNVRTFAIRMLPIMGRFEACTTVCRRIDPHGGLTHARQARSIRSADHTSASVTNLDPPPGFGRGLFPFCSPRVNVRTFAIRMLPIMEGLKPPTVCRRIDPHGGLTHARQARSIRSADHTSAIV